MNQRQRERERKGEVQKWRTVGFVGAVFQVGKTTGWREKVEMEREKVDWSPVLGNGGEIGRAHV